MGPNDPFATSDAAPAGPAGPPADWPDDLPTVRAPARGRSVASPAMLGFGIGVGFGLLALLTSVPQSLAVLAFGGLGALLAVVVQSFRQMSPDLGAAWAALRQNNNGGLPPMPGGR